MPDIANWSPKRFIITLSACLAAFVTFIVNAETLAEYQPFATKGMLVAQAETFTKEVASLRWGQIADQIDNLQFQLSQKRFQLIQLEDLIKDDPDQIKTDAKESLIAEIEVVEQRLTELRCQFRNRDRDWEVICQ